MDMYSTGVTVVFTLQQILLATLRRYDDVHVVESNRSNVNGCLSLPYVENLLGYCSLTQDDVMLVQGKQLCEAFLVLVLLTCKTTRPQVSPSLLTNMEGKKKIPGRASYEEYKSSVP